MPRDLDRRRVLRRAVMAPVLIGAALLAGLPLCASVAAAASVATPASPANGPPATAAPGHAPSGDEAGAAESVYCPICGARNRLGSRFCLKDGTPLPAVDLARRRPGFVRSPGTFSPEEIQAVMQRIAQSVVRIRVRTTTNYKYPVAWWKDRVAEYYGRAMLGRIETSEGDARLSGSGFVISEAGGIVTNAHVARPDGMSAELTVETLDKRTFPARLLGVDAASDLALLKIDTDSIPPLSWGDSRALRAGQEAWAIGNPLDIGISITRGTMSGVISTRAGFNQVEAFIHTDAHITHGNSGGPLVDVYGRVLGVNDIGFAEEKGQGYAIPSLMARLVTDRLSARGRYDRGFIGLHVRPVDTDTIKKFGLSRQDGTVVEAILEGSPAARAGFLPGDVLIGINGRQAGSSYLLQEAVSSVGPGAAVTLTLDRHGTTIDLPVTTVLRPEAPRIDPLQELEGYLRIRFEEDARKRQVIIRNPSRSRRAPGLFSGLIVRSVMPAQDWPEEPVTHNYYRTRAKPAPIDSLEGLRVALKRAYLGGRMAVTFEVSNPAAPIASVVFDELWQIIL